MKARSLTTVDLPVGTVLVLDPAQARARRHALVALGNGAYRTAAAVQFKAGEVFGLDGDIGKTALAALDILDLPPVTAAGQGAARRRGRAAPVAAPIAAAADE